MIYLMINAGVEHQGDINRVSLPISLQGFHRLASR